LCRLAEQLRCKLSGLLGAAERQVISGRMSRYVFEVLIERLEGQRRRNGLSFQEIADLEKAKASPARKPK